MSVGRYAVGRGAGHVAATKVLGGLPQVLRSPLKFACQGLVALCHVAHLRGRRALRRSQNPAHRLLGTLVAYGLWVQAQRRALMRDADAGRGRETEERTG